MIIICNCYLLGGFLQSVINGFPGVRLYNGYMKMAPTCPQLIDSVKLRALSYLGNEMDIEYFCQSSTGM